MNVKYEKDYDSWNEKKKELNSKVISEDFFFLEGEIWWASVGVNVDGEIDGKNDSFIRPILIVKKFTENLMLALPITSTRNESEYFHRVCVGKIHGVVSLMQLRTMSINRLLKLMGRMRVDDFQVILRKIIDLFENNETASFKKAASQIISV